MVTHKIYSLKANKGIFHILVFSKLITSFIDCFTPGMKSQFIAYLLSGSEHIGWVLDLEGEVHSLWIL